MPKRKCTFNSELQNKYPMLKRGKYDWEVLCTICSTNISIANKGVSDINDHLNTQKHKTNSKGQASSSNITTFFGKTRSSSEENLIRAAEGAMAYHTVNHHMSFNSLDCSNSLNQVMFPESNTAKNMTCNRTKATAIVNNVLSPFSIAELKNDLKDVLFISVSTDATNHGSTKLFPIIIQYFDKQRNGITSKLLEIESTKNETSDTVVEIILKQLREQDLLSKCVAFSGDNCNTNFGGNSRAGTNNVFYKLKAQLNPNIVGIGCTAHILHNAVHHGCDLLPIDVEMIILKIYNFFSIYTVRTEALKEFCAASELEYKHLLFHSKTRWLTLFPAIERFLKMYDALKNYFESLDRPPVLIKRFFEDPLSQAYLFLVHSVMHVFHAKIEKVEKSDNSVIEIRNIFTYLNKTLEDRIKENFVPIKVQNILDKQDENTKVEFKKRCIDFYKEMKSYLEKWEKPLKYFDKFDWMILPNITESTSWSDVEKTVLFLKEINIEIDDTKLIDEWVNLKAFSLSLSDKDKLLSANQLWVKFFKTPNAHLYCEMLKIAQYYFCVPAHNANVERVLSLVTQQWTKERNSLNLHTVSSLIKIKYNFKDLSCSDFYRFLLEKKDILANIGITEKYQHK